MHNEPNSQCPKWAKTHQTSNNKWKINKQQIYSKISVKNSDNRMLNIICERFKQKLPGKRYIFFVSLNTK